MASLSLCGCQGFINKCKGSRPKSFERKSQLLRSIETTTFCSFGAPIVSGGADD